MGSTGDYRPLTWCDPETGRWEGFCVDVAERIAAEMGVKPSVVRNRLSRGREKLKKILVERGLCCEAEYC